MAVKKRGRKPAKKAAAAKKPVKKAGRKPTKRKKAVKRGKKAKSPKKKARKKPSSKGSKKRATSRAASKKRSSRKSKSASTSLTGAQKKIRDFLHSKNIAFDIIKHSPAYTAQQVAASAHISGYVLAKTVIVKIDDKLAMVLEAAHVKVDLDALKRHFNAQRVALANEAEFRNSFPECELGAMPPLGNLYNMDVYVDSSLSQSDKIAFNAGTHTELIRMSYKDFHQLVHPKVLRS